LRHVDVSALVVAEYENFAVESNVHTGGLDRIIVHRVYDYAALCQFFVY
jgi:hypothetical protein